jgi:hypothetical protein
VEKRVLIGRRRIAVIAFLLSAAVVPAAHAGFFGDDFNRPDGSVGNGWTPFAVLDASDPDHLVVGPDPRISIVSGEVSMPGVDRYAAGIWRPLAAPAVFPVVFSYEFRTDDPGGGWMLAVNVEPSSSSGPRLPYPPYSTAQIAFFQAAGLSEVSRLYRATSGPGFGFDSQHAVDGNQRAYRIDQSANVHLVILPDLTATITIDYHDGDAPAVFIFPPAVNAHSQPPGNILTVGTSAGALFGRGHYFFDDLQFFDNVPPASGGGPPPPTGVKTVSIDIKPGNEKNLVNPKSRGTLRVAILSTPDCNAPAVVNQATLRFGRTGNEQSLQRCEHTAHDVTKPKDGLRDLICFFDTEVAGFTSTDTQGVLTGVMLTGQPIIATDKITPKPSPKPKK